MIFIKSAVVLFALSLVAGEGLLIVNLWEEAPFNDVAKIVITCFFTAVAMLFIAGATAIARLD